MKPIVKVTCAVCGRVFTGYPNGAGAFIPRSHRYNGKFGMPCPGQQQPGEVK